jgi:hypothetical protein
MKAKIAGMVTSYVTLWKNEPLASAQSDWLWHQTPHSFGRWGNVQMIANAEKPDFLVLYNFEFPQLYPPTKKQRLKTFLTQGWKPAPSRDEIILPLFRSVPKERIISLWREPPLDEYLEIYNRNYQVSKNYCGYVYAPDDSAPIPDYMPAIWYHGNSFRELNEMPAPEKVKACSWITSGIDRSNNHKQRLEFLKTAQEQELNFDLYGRNLPIWAKSNGALSNKWHAMAPYYYNLAIENYAANSWYVTEKLWDALLAWCLPIYYGGPAADKLLPAGSFIRLPNLDKNGINFIKEVIASPDLWRESLPAIAEARQVILHELNLLNWLSNQIIKNPST